MGDEHNFKMYRNIYFFGNLPLGIVSSHLGKHLLCSVDNGAEYRFWMKETRQVQVLLILVLGFLSNFRLSTLQSSSILKFNELFSRSSSEIAIEAKLKLGEGCCLLGQKVFGGSCCLPESGRSLQKLILSVISPICKHWLKNWWLSRILARYWNMMVILRCPHSSVWSSVDGWGDVLNSCRL